MKNTLFYGDNLTVLREHVADESVDLVYLDPPFNSSRSYNVLFRDESGRDSDAQITAFEDSWHWGRAARDTFAALVTAGPERVATLMDSLHRLLGENQMMAYLVMMTARLLELRRVLKPAGSLYLHCDPTASHYLKLALDTIFGEWNFRSEIVWQRTAAHDLGAKQWSAIHDIIYMYSRSSSWCWNVAYEDYDDEYKRRNFPYEDERGKYTTQPLTGGKAGSAEAYGEWRQRLPSKGRAWAIPAGYSRLPDWLKEVLPPEQEWEQLGIHSKLDFMDSHGMIHWPKKADGVPRFKYYLNDAPGKIAGDTWTNIPKVAAHARERLGYPTQKPLALLERIIRASSNEGDVVLDPFCGCGTAIDAAEGLGRRWLGIDVTHLSVALMKYRLRDRHGLRAGLDYEVVGEPRDLAGARQLAREDRYQFQFWAASLVAAQPLGGQGGREGKRGADGGIDGVIRFLERDGRRTRTQRVLVQIKSGRVGVGDLRDLLGVVESEQAAIGVFLTLRAPTRPMRTFALQAGFWQSETWGRFDRLQILTVEELLAGAQPDLPRGQRTFQQAQFARERRDEFTGSVFGRRDAAED